RHGIPLGLSPLPLSCLGVPLTALPLLQQQEIRQNLATRQDRMADHRREPQFLSTGWKGHPEKFIFDRMAKYSSNVFRTSLLGEKAAVFCGASGNKFLFSNENKLVQAWWPASVDKVFPPSGATSSSKEEAIKMRKMLPNFFNPKL
ncbi:hypothetical protein RJ639_019379, partial [Escallonia herrerae]